MRLLREHDFRLPYDPAHAESLHVMVREWEVIEHRFHDPVIESARDRLCGKLREWLDMVAAHAVDVGSGHVVVAVSPARQRTVTQERTCALITEKARTVWEAHQALVAAAHDRALL